MCNVTKVVLQAFIATILLASVISVSCEASLFLNKCTGTDEGAQCYYKYYLSSANTCASGAIASPISHCVKYWDDSDIVSSSEPSPLQCRMCEVGYNAETNLTETDASKKYRCRTGDGGIANCMYPGKYVFANGTILRYCMGCESGFIGKDYNAFTNAPTSCTKNAAATTCVTNCEYCSMNGPLKHYCWACKSGFVAANDGLSCVAESIKTLNCQFLSSSDTAQCETCWWPYYFQGSSCAKSS